MSDQVSATLKTLLNTMQLLSESLENEKQQHIELLKKLNSHVSNSQTEIKNDFFDFLNKIELQEFVSIVQDSKLNIENNQKSILQLNAEIMQIRQTAKQSLAELEQQNLDLSKKISGSSDKITSDIIKNVANDVKESVTQNFSLQFKEQNQTLILEAKKANSTVITNIIEIYNHLNKQVLSVTKDHRESLSQFKTDVSAFTESINIAINSVKDSFAEVEELKAHYRRGGLGDGTVKKRLEGVLKELILPIRERRAELEKDPDYIMDILKHGTDKCRDITQQTLDEVKSGLGLFKF